MASMYEMLLDLMGSDQFVDSVVRKKEEQVEKNSGIEEFAVELDSPEDDEQFDLIQIGEDLEWRYNIYLTELLREYVFNLLPEPHPITLKELERLSDQQISWVSPDRDEVRRAVVRIAVFAHQMAETTHTHGIYDADDWPILTFGELFEGILGEVRVAISDECLRHARGRAWNEFAAKLRDEEKLDFQQIQFPWDSPVWESTTGFSLWLLPAFGEVCELHGLLTGNVTEGALSCCRNRLKPILQSILKTVSLAAVDSERPSNRYLGPRIGYMYREGVRLLNFCLDAYFAWGHESIDSLPIRVNSTTDEFTRRICNAVLLLEEADRTPSNAIKLALSFSAIEALCCKEPRTKEDLSIGLQIKKYIPLLMCPEVVGRGKRGSVLWELYDTRSRVLHGSKVSTERESAQIARTVAAGALRAVTHWRALRLENRESAEWSVLNAELDKLACKGGAVIPDAVDLTDLLPKKLPSD